MKNLSYRICWMICLQTFQTFYSTSYVHVYNSTYLFDRPLKAGSETTFLTYGGASTDKFDIFKPTSSTFWQTISPPSTQSSSFTSTAHEVEALVTFTHLKSGTSLVVSISDFVGSVTFSLLDSAKPLELHSFCSGSAVN
ncbi:hypothetical protein Hdeb2414_s0314g00864971 [Helianthus debilis subsp. tardiflorus]